MTGMHVHLVGSVGLASTQEVFATAGKLLGEHLLRVPDGEPGGRRMWINWQFPLLRGLSFLHPDWDTKPAVTGCLALKIIDGTKPEDIHFGELGYAREARTSYRTSWPPRKTAHYRQMCASRSACRRPSRCCVRW